MAGPYRNNVSYLVEDACVNFVTATGLTEGATPAAIFPGLNAEGQTLPKVIFICGAAVSAVPFEGNWQADLRIEVHSSIDDTTRAQHHLIVGEVFSLFMTASIADDLSAALADFTCQFAIPRRQGHGVDRESRCWISFLEFELHVCGSDIG